MSEYIFVFVAGWFQVINILEVSSMTFHSCRTPGRLASIKNVILFTYFLIFTHISISPFSGNFKLKNKVAAENLQVIYIKLYRRKKYLVFDSWIHCIYSYGSMERKYIALLLSLVKRIVSTSNTLATRKLRANVSKLSNVCTSMEIHIFLLQISNNVHCQMQLYEQSHRSFFEYKSLDKEPSVSRNDDSDIRISPRIGLRWPFGTRKGTKTTPEPSSNSNSDGSLLRLSINIVLSSLIFRTCSRDSLKKAV